MLLLVNIDFVRCSTKSHPEIQGGFLLNTKLENLFDFFDFGNRVAQAALNAHP
jgi:hypothetical protein